MRTLILISAAAVGLAFSVPASAMPVASQGVSAKSEQVTQVRMKRHHHRMRHMRRTRGDLSTGLPGKGPTQDMSKTNGGRAGDR